MLLPPVIVRSSSINEDNYGDAQAGNYFAKDLTAVCISCIFNAPASVNNCEEKSSFVFQQLPFLLLLPIQMMHEMFLVY